MSDDELPDINVTRGEKALAAVLTIFLVIGGAVGLLRAARPRGGPRRRSRRPRSSVAIGALEAARVAPVRG